MANELLKSPEGDAVPQNLKDGVSVSASDLDGDDTVWEIFDDPAQGGGSTLQDIVDDLNATLEVTDDGSFNATVSGTVGLEAGDGSGTVEEVQQTNNALDVYLSAQNGNFSVDLQNDAVGLASETTLSNIASALSSNGGDVLQVEQQTPIEIEADDGTGTVDNILRTGNGLNVQIVGQDTNFGVDLKTDETDGSGLATENTLTSLSEALTSETDNPDTLRVQIQNVQRQRQVVKDVGQISYQGTNYPIEFEVGEKSNTGPRELVNAGSDEKCILLSYSISLDGNVDATFEGTATGPIAYVKGDTGEVKNISRDPHGIIGETQSGQSLQLTTGDARPISYRISYALVSA